MLDSCIVVLLVKLHFRSDASCSLRDTCEDRKLQPEEQATQHKAGASKAKSTARPRPAARVSDAMTLTGQVSGSSAWMKVGHGKRDRDQAKAWFQPYRI
jgi:hypothetical protein